jgi:hypothetical protein
MENGKKLPEGFLDLYETLLSAQLRAIRQLRSGRRKPARGKGLSGRSKMSMAIDILQKARRPMHVSEIIALVKGTYGVTLDRESLASALVKKVLREQGVVRTAPNTFEAIEK